jgi:hypothetical protein
MFYATSMLWVIGAPVAFFLLAILFARSEEKLLLYNRISKRTEISTTPQ